MGRNRNSKRTEEGSIVIVCEGEKTENYFFKHLYAHLVADGLCSLKVEPVIIPLIREDEQEEKISSKRKPKGKQLSQATTDSVKIGFTIETGEPPLKWVKTALNSLESHTEAWAVFDNDNHPARKEAFDLVYQKRNEGKNINIAFSSLSFEYFMLQFYEYIYHKFSKTECHTLGKKRIYLDCCSNSPLEGACNGELDSDCCINGYAHNKRYWNKSKVNTVFASLPNLWQGINNAYKVKWNSISTDKVTPVYERNPYLNTYRLLLRYYGIKSIEQGSSLEIPYKGKSVYFGIKNHDILIKNETNVILILKINTCEPDSSKTWFTENNSETKKIDANTSFRFHLESVNDKEFIIFDVEGIKIFVTDVPNTNLTEEDNKMFNITNI